MQLIATALCVYIAHSVTCCSDISYNNILSYMCMCPICFYCAAVPWTSPSSPHWLNGAYFKRFQETDGNWRNTSATKEHINKTNSRSMSELGQLRTYWPIFDHVDPNELYLYIEIRVLQGGCQCQSSLPRLLENCLKPTMCQSKRALSYRLDNSGEKGSALHIYRMDSWRSLIRTCLK